MTDEQISNLMPRVNQEWAGFQPRAALHRCTVCRLLLMNVFLLAALTTSASALSIDLTSGTTGSIDLNQSFNGESRAADITVLGAVNQVVDSMTVSGVSIRDSSALVGARIYDDTTQTAIAMANILVPIGEQQTITVPISATLIAGNSYRVTFFVPSSTTGNDGNLFVPTGGFGYVESQGLFRVNAGWDGFGDIFPATTNISIPQTLGFDVVPEPSSVALLALGLAGLCLREKSSLYL